MPSASASADCEPFGWTLSFQLNLIGQLQFTKPHSLITESSLAGLLITEKLTDALLICWKINAEQTDAERLKKRSKWKESENCEIYKSLKNGDNLLNVPQKFRTICVFSYSSLSGVSTHLSAISVIGTSFYRSDKVRNFQIVDILKCKTLINRSCTCFIRQSSVNHQTVFNQFWYLYPFHSLFDWKPFLSRFCCDCHFIFLDFLLQVL